MKDNKIDPEIYVRIALYGTTFRLYEYMQNEVGKQCYTLLASTAPAPAPAAETTALAEEEKKTRLCRC